MSLILAEKFLVSIRRVAAIGLALVIAACGGGDTSTSSSGLASKARSDSAGNPPLQSAALANLPTQTPERKRALAVPAGAVTVPAIAASPGAHSLALNANGTVWAWGHGGDGELGNNSVAGSSVPVQVLGSGGTGVIAGCSVRR